MKIAIVAPSCPLKQEAAERVTAIVAARADCELLIHPQCFLSDGHFAGADNVRHDHGAGMEVAWGPMPQDVIRDRGDDAVERALDWLVARDPASLESGLDGPAMAFNLTVLSMLLGTPLEPDLAGVDLLIEEVSEHHYEIDRLMFHLVASGNVRRVRRIRLGRVSDVPENDPPFGVDEEAIVAAWCARAGISYGGRADIGHDARNRVVPFTSG